MCLPKKQCFLILTFFFASITITLSQTQLPGIFSDQMIMQQQAMVGVWGTDKPNTKVVVKGGWDKEAKATADANGQWKVKLQTPVAGGPFTVTIKGSTQVVLKDVLVGEVWLCSGQSNMQMSVKGNFDEPLGSNEMLLNSSNNNIRMFTQQRVGSISPIADTKGEWELASPLTTGNFSAAAYFFAKKLQAILGVPIGIIHTSWGSSPVAAWMDRETLSNFKHVAIPDTLPKTGHNITPMLLYNAMLHPYINYTIKGVLWYQGEANRANYSNYQAMFTAMISSWRKQWQQGDFPFYFVQIAPFAYAGGNAAFLREAQMKTMQSVPQTGMAVTMDIGEEKNIHPVHKETVGNRLAYWALTKDYNIKGIAYSGPVYKAMEKTKDGKIKLMFNYAEMGLNSFGKPLNHFEIAGDDKVFYPATATISNQENSRGVTVWSDSVKNPVSVRYGFQNWVVGNLFNGYGLPASSFRTDDW